MKGFLGRWKDVDNEKNTRRQQQRRAYTELGRWLFCRRMRRKEILLCVAVFHSGIG